MVVKASNRPVVSVLNKEHCTHSSKGVGNAQPDGGDEGVDGGEGQNTKHRDGQQSAHEC